MRRRLPKSAADTPEPAAAAIVITCEHAGNRVPTEYAHLFASARAQTALKTHRGYDLGALPIARTLGRQLDVSVISHDVTRLLVDVNRSVGHPRLFSEFSRALTVAERAEVLERHYEPHRRAVLAAVEHHVSAGQRVLHLSVHSFTPRLNGRVRTAEVGLLYDPVRRAEADFSARWKGALEAGGTSRGLGRRNKQSDWRIRRNYPYRGASDGLTTSLRRAFPRTSYLGIELEVNQAMLTKAAQKAVGAAFAGSLAATL